MGGQVGTGGGGVSGRTGGAVCQVSGLDSGRSLSVSRCVLAALQRQLSILFIYY